MIVNLLNGLLNGKIAENEIINWLSADKPHHVVLPDIVESESVRAEFVLFFLDYLRKQCPGIHENVPREADAIIKEKSLPKKPANSSWKCDQEVAEPATITCHTSTPVKSPTGHRTSFENDSTSFNGSPQSSPITKQSSNLAETCEHSFELENSSSDSSNYSFPFIPVSPLYGGPSLRMHASQNQSLNFSDENFPSINQRNLERSFNSKQNDPSERHKASSSSSNQSISGNAASGNKKSPPLIHLSDFLFVNSSRKPSRKNGSRNQDEIGLENSSEKINEKSDQEKKKRSRRIKPTKVEITSEKRQVFGVIARPETKNPKFLEAQTAEEVTSLEAERELLKLERQRKPKTNEALENTEERKVSKGWSMSTASVMPDPALVENCNILDRLAAVYGNLLRRNLVPNPMTELYFIVTLITMKPPPEALALQHLKESLGCRSLDEVEETAGARKYLESPHNCLYFGTTVLYMQRRLLVAMDRATVKLLMDNPHIGTFKPSLRTFLTRVYESSVLGLGNLKENFDPGSNVCFQVDTDNPKNFPSSSAFSKFRIQRDVFYETLKTWEDNHHMPNFNFCAILERKIHMLLSLNDDATTYYHLARLFKAQMLTSCLQQQEDPVDDESLDFLKSLRSVNLVKFKQLQERLITPASSTGLVPKPTFSGVQEFYRDFILTSNNTKFNTILEYCFIQEIMELNDTPFASNDLELVVDETMKRKYLICISNLRLLAKFLGFLVSLPFRSESAVLAVTNMQIALRAQVTPSIDLASCLSAAITNQRLTLVVPWVVEYLANLDSIALRLPYYSKICETLYGLYRIGQFHLWAKPALLITFLVGWLFALPNFPRDLYITWQLNFNNEKIRHLLNWQTNSAAEGKKIGESLRLDCLNVVDDHVIHVCCPFLRELRTLLISGNSNFSSSMNRHITPVSSQLSPPSNETKAKLLQLQQEDVFFHGQPNSVKKTIDFVSERIASNSVKTICRDIIPKIKDKHFAAFREVAMMKILEFPDYGIKQKKAMHQEYLSDDNCMTLISAIVEELREECKAKVPQSCRKKCGESLVPLLAEDTYPAVKEVCVKICTRMAIEKVDQWLHFYVNDAANTKQLKFEYFCWTPQGKDSPDRKVQHNPEAPCPTEMIKLIRNSMWELCEKQGRWSTLDESTVLSLLRGLVQTLNEREDLETMVKKILYVLSVDYAVHLIIYNDDLFTNTVMNEFIGVWKQKTDSATLFSGILSFRNVQMLAPCTTLEIWRKFGRLIERLLRENLLGIEQFSNQCVELLRYEWPKNVMNFLPNCLNEVTKGFKSSDEETEKMKLLLDWISETCGDIDCLDGATSTLNHM